MKIDGLLVALATVPREIVFHTGNELVAHRHGQCGVGLYDGIEAVCGVELQLVVEA